jgi:hypothetical protein
MKLSDIKDLSLLAVRENRFLEIYHLQGKLRITSSFLPDEAAFDKFCSAIRKHATIKSAG